MDSVLFAVIMVAFGWLVAWICADRSKPTNTWWPFDYKDGDKSAAPGTVPNARRPWDRRKPTTPWNRSGF
jgi:hypothetical protein